MIETFAQYAPHKTFLVQGNEAAFGALKSELLERDSTAYVLELPRFTADDAAELVTFIGQGTGSERYSLIYFSVFSPEAAQILLKSLEEPDVHTTVLMVTPYPYVIPATIRSRVMLIASDALVYDDAVVPPTRDAALALVKKEFGSDADEDAAVRRAKATVFLDVLESRLKKAPLKARYIYEAKEMLFRNNMPTKYVLEYAVTMAM